jgi:hypothetical protein
MASTIVHPYDASEYTVSIGGQAVPWTQIEYTLEQFHVPATFSVTTPLSAIDLPQTLGDKPVDVVIRRKGADVFVGMTDDSEGLIDHEADPEDQITIMGRDLSAKFAMDRENARPPMNLTASEVVARWARDKGFTDLSGITATTDQIGEFVKSNYHRLYQHLSQHDVLFDLAEFEHFVFRVKGRKVYFGPQPAVPAANQRTIVFDRDANKARWRKNHTNADVKVRVLGRSAKGQKIAQTQGEGSLVITKVLLAATTPDAARKLAIRTLERAVRGIVTLDIENLPGDATVDDVTFAFDVQGIAKGIDQKYEPARVHHILTQDTHIMDLSLFNSARITA